MSDYLPFIYTPIIQPEQFYHFNSDSVFLGQFINVKHRDTVLDIGCQTGVLLLYAERFEPMKMVGIDLFEEVLSVAKENVKYPNTVFEKTRLQSYYPTFQFEVIMCNPPYFVTTNETLKNENPYLKVARHEENLPLDELFQNVKRLLKTNGKFFVVHRTSRMMEVILAANKVNLHCTRMQLAYKSIDQQASSVCFQFEFSNKKECKVEKPFLLNEIAKK